jgi:hypothetical protein
LGHTGTPYGGPKKPIPSLVEPAEPRYSPGTRDGPSPINTANQVDPYVYVGGYLAAADPEFLRREGITRVVKLFADDDSYPGGACRLPGVKYLVLPALDTPSYDIRGDMMAAVRYIKEAIANDEKVLVHCHAGVSRSPTVVLLYLMIVRNYELWAALARLRMLRPVINPNDGFMAHLGATDTRLHRLRVGDEKQYIAPPPILMYEAEKEGYVKPAARSPKWRW